MSKINRDDICQFIAESPRHFFENGFYYDFDGNLITREQVREQLGNQWGLYADADLNRFEGVVIEHCRPQEKKDPRKVYLDNIKTQNGECFILSWLEKQYPDIAWKHILYDIVMHKTEKIYIFRGINDAGKSQVMDLLKILFDSFCLEMTVDDLSNKFNLGEVSGKLFVCGDDLGREDFGQSIGKIKSLSTGSTIRAERKFMNTTKVVFKGNFMFCTNNKLILDITDEGVLRRVVEFVFDRKMELPCEYEEYREKYINEIEASRLLSQLQKVKFDKSVVQKVNNSTIIRQLTESPDYKAGGKDYEKYVDYCKKNGYKPRNVDNYNKVWTLIDRYCSIIPVVINEEDLPF